MLGHEIFNFNTIDRMAIAFGTLFDDIRINRTNSSNTTTQVIQVPLTYAPKNKLLLRANVDPDATKPAPVTLPHLAYQIMPPFQYDGDRKLPPLEKYVALDPDNANKLRRQYVPVPYNLTMELYVYANHITDGNKIVEQILPFFTPDWTVTVQFCELTDIKFDVPITLTGVSMDDNHWDGSMTERRVLVWTLSFLVKTYFLGPVRSKPIIKFANERFLIAPDASSNTDVVANTDIIATVQVKPGMDANGAATSNASITVDANTIYATNTYGYIETFSNNGPVAFS